MHQALILLALALSAFADEEPASQPAAVQHRLPVISRVFPQGWQPGTSLEVEILGEHLDRASQVVFLDSSITGRILEVSVTRALLQFEIAAGAALGEHYFRVISPRGASGPMLFRIGDQRHRNEKEPNSRMEEAERIDAPVTINARLERDSDFDFFRFHTEAGQRWIFDLRAARNGNGLDSALILLDARGRKLEHVEDHFIWDPFFAHTFTEAGDYTVVVQPSHTRNDPNFTYQLDVRQAAYLQTISPLSLAPGSETEVTVFGEGLSDGSARLWFDAAGLSGRLLQARGNSALVQLRVSPDAKPGPHRMRWDSRGMSNPATLLVDATPAHKAGDEITIPVSITGTARYRQPERFQFQAEAGQTLVFEVRAQRFGSPVDSMLRILDAQGKAIASNDDATVPGVAFNKDSRIRHKFEKAGQYTVEMRNVSAVTGENYPYQLLVMRPQPSVELMFATDQPYLYPGETRKWKVNAVRQDDFAGDIELVVNGLPAGVEAKPARIAEGSSDVEIELRAMGAAVGTYAAIEVTASQAQSPAWRSARISSGGGEGATFARVNRAALVVAEKPLFSLEAAATSLNLVRGGTAELKVMVRRQPGFEGVVTYQAANLPEGVRVETVSSGAEIAVLRFHAKPDARIGRASRVAILGAGAGQTQEAPKISLLVD
ncbi:MAG: hypothetical protein JJE04_08630 [Acidobacteriia bacterium]|nr:hypothetical protein [Terriglobia bacterium]